MEDPREKMGAQIAFRLPEDLDKFLRREARAQDRSIAWILRDIVKKWASKEKEDLPRFRPKKPVHDDAK